ncbi:MAG: hypothetical protein NZM28_02265 [Fimbriimonadales bacterium]|nr:hypothetical protein [Fimbriimonadales bacterium]
MRYCDPEYDFEGLADLSEYDSPLAYDGDLEDWRRDVEWDYEYHDGEWEYYADFECDYDYDF